jgi:hypothetical protein
VSVAKRNLKEAGGKIPGRRTETAYKAKARRTSFQNKTKSQMNRLSARPLLILPEPCNVNAAATWDEGYRTLTWGGLDDTHKGKNPEQPIQRCTAERPEVSRGHSTVKGDVPCRGSTSGAGRAEQWKSHEREECKTVQRKQKTASNLWFAPAVCRRAGWSPKQR